MAPLLARQPRVDRSFEKLYTKHATDVYRYAFGVLRNEADAEDVTQTTFLNAYRALERGETPNAPHNWLIAIAHNVCRQRFRQASRRPLEIGLDDDVADAFVEPEDDNAPSPEDIRRAMQHLAFNQRAALVMRELEGRSYAEIASLLDLSVGAVETLIFRARRALREQLEGSLTCGEAEFAISRQLDRRLSRQERGQLRAHLRECSECAAFARRQRAQRGALKSLALVPLPGSLGSLFGGGGAAVGTGLGLKAVAAVTAGVVIGGASVATVRQAPWKPHPAPVVRSTPLPSFVSAPAKQSTSHGKTNVSQRSRANAHGRALGHRKRGTRNAASHRAAHVKKHAHPVHPPHPVARVRGRAALKPKPAKVRPLPRPNGNGGGKGKKP